MQRKPTVGVKSGHTHVKSFSDVKIEATLTYLKIYFTIDVSYLLDTSVVRKTNKQTQSKLYIYI